MSDNDCLMKDCVYWSESEENCCELGYHPPNCLRRIINETCIVPTIRISEGQDGKKTAPKNNIHEAKPRPSLLPMDLLNEFLTPAYTEGLVKYFRESWREGFNTSDMLDAAIRHLIKFFWEGEIWDADAREVGVNKTHLGGALFSILCMCHTIKSKPDLDDRPEPVDRYEPKATIENAVMKKILPALEKRKLLYCSKCGNSEIAEIISGKGTELIEMIPIESYHQCAECMREQRSDINPPIK